jgi:DNA-binding CsgD family transcriptional regulator
VGEMEKVIENLDRIRELIEFIHSENPDGNSLLQFLVLRTLSECNAVNASILELKPGGLIIPVFQFGHSEEEMKSWAVSSIDERLPSADALKNNDFVWLADRDEWYNDYPSLAKYKIPEAFTYIVWPINIRGSYMSIIGVSFNKVLEPAYELKNKLAIISGLVGLQISAQKKSKLTVEQDPSVWNLLTNRQHKIVAMMAENKTNNQIASELGYSQSTIRQDTIKIYEMLGVAGRKGATQAYRVSFPIHGTVNN